MKKPTHTSAAPGAAGGSAPLTPSSPKSIATELSTLVLDAWRALTSRPGGALTLATALLLLWQYYGFPYTYDVRLDKALGAWRYQPIAGSLYWFATNVLMLLVVPLLAARWLWRRPARSLGLGAGNWRVGVAAVAIGYLVMLPAVILASTWADFRWAYPLDPDALRSHELFWVYEAGYASFFVGWEFFFRGFLLFILEPAFGLAAVAMQMVPFALMHVGKPIAETLGSVIAGIILGALALRTRSIWYGVALHAAVALTLDIIVYVRWGPPF